MAHGDEPDDGSEAEDDDEEEEVENVCGCMTEAERWRAAQFSQTA